MSDAQKTVGEVSADTTSHTRAVCPESAVARSRLVDRHQLAPASVHSVPEYVVFLIAHRQPQTAPSSLATRVEEERRQEHTPNTHPNKDRLSGDEQRNEYLSRTLTSPGTQTHVTQPASSRDLASMHLPELTPFLA